MPQFNDVAQLTQFCDDGSIDLMWDRLIESGTGLDRRVLMIISRKDVYDHLIRITDEVRESFAQVIHATKPDLETARNLGDQLRHCTASLIRLDASSAQNFVVFSHSDIENAR